MTVTSMRNSSILRGVATKGGVLQVVSATTTTTTTTSNTSYQDTSLAATITPSSTSSKVYVSFSGTLQKSGNLELQAFVTIFRGNASSGTNLGSASGFGRLFVNAIVGGGGGTIAAVPTGGVFLDSPSTGSAVTYTVALKADRAAAVNFEGTQSIVLMEVAG